MSNLIHQLRKNGYRVRIIHSRYCRDNKNLVFAVEVPKGERDTFLPRGGVTEAKITTPDGREASSSAHCSNADAFCYKRGANIAVRRALKELGIALTEIPVK